MSLAIKAGFIWIATAVVAVLNGIAREMLFVPLMGISIARPLSVLVLLVAVFLLTWLLLRWVDGPLSSSTAWLVGVSWVVLTVAFESAVGLFVRKISLAEVMQAYSPFSPNLWLLVLFGVLLAPPTVNALLGYYVSKTSGN